MYKAILEPINFPNKQYPEDIWQRFGNFLEAWHGISLKVLPKLEIDSQYSLPPVPRHLEHAIGFLLSLCCHTAVGQKGKRYSVAEYIFRFQTICLGYDDELRAITLLREGGQDFYYAVKLDDFVYNDPPITRFYRGNKKEAYHEAMHGTLLELFTYHLFCEPAKPRVKFLGSSFENFEITALLKTLSPLFEHKITATKYTLWEGTNGIMLVYPLVSHETSFVLRIYRWDNKQKEFSNTIRQITGCEWSDNSLRYRL